MLGTEKVKVEDYPHLISNRMQAFDLHPLPLGRGQGRGALNPASLDNAPILYSEISPQITHKTITQTCLNCGKTWIAELLCSDKLCFECSSKRANHHSSLLLLLLSILNPKDSTMRFLTLTVKNTFNLPECYDKLRYNFSRLREHTLWKNNVFGGCYSIEITKGDFGWHVHLHCLYVGNFIPQDELRAAWAKLTKDSFIVDIRPIKNLSKMRREICKYPFKPLSAELLSDNEQIELNNFLHNKVLFVRLGSWREIDLKPNPARCCSCGSTLVITLTFESEDIRTLLRGDLPQTYDKRDWFG